MAKRNPYILESFAEFLDEHLPGIKDLPIKTRFHFAHLIFKLDDKRLKHNRYEDYSFLPYQELYGNLRKADFDLINASLDLFEIMGDWSKTEKRTRGIRLTDKLSGLKKEFLSLEPVLSHLLNVNGTRLKTVSVHAIETEVTARKRKYTALKVTVPINRDALDIIITKLRSADRHVSGIEVGHLIGQAQKIKHYSTLKATDEHELILRYSESPSGRLYGKGVHLQNVPRFIKDAALSGYWEYDFENCHFAIMSQLADRIGVCCKHIAFYLENKKEIRVTIAQKVGITVEQVKQCLLGKMYGAMDSQWHKNAIPRLIGSAKAERLYKHEIFANLSRELEGTRTAIIQNWPDVNRRSYVNAMGLPIDKKVNGKKQCDKKVIAHLLQGIEAKMLHIALRQYDTKILLLQHDGFVTSEQIDIQIISDKIRDEMGFVMGISVCLLGNT